MADLFTLTAPLLIQYPDGEKRLLVDKYPHPRGMVYTIPYWMETPEPLVILAEGEIKGEGPWKVGDAIVRLLSCGDTELSMEWAQWQQFLQTCPGNHPYNDEAARLAIIDKVSYPA